MKRNYQTIRTKGFTLIEMMTAVSVFLVVMTISMGAILGVFDANRKSESLKTVMDNLNFAVETMSREIRFGTKYHCGSDTPIPFNITQDCQIANTEIAFLASDGVTTNIYRLNNSSIEKSVDGGSTFLPVTAPEIVIKSLDFYVTGSTFGNLLQPKILIKITGSAGKNANAMTNFTLQTLASQRLPDK